MSGGSEVSDIWIDSLALSRIALPRLSSHKLASMAELFGCASVSHRANADVEALCGVWRILLCGLDDLPLGLMRRLADMHPDVPWSYRPIFSFLAGSHPDAVFSLVSARHDILAADSSSAAGSSARIDADELPGLNLPSREEVEACFEPDGLVNRMYPGYEPRMEQVQMAAEVRDALATSSHRVIEAGTGVGKSIAYLVPFAQAAKRNNITVGIATKSNNLADQLMYHELPRLAREIEGGLTYCASRAMTTTPACENLSAWRAPARSTPRATQQTRSPPSPLSTPTPANRPLAISMDWAFAGGVCERPISPPPHANALGGCAPFTPTNVWSTGLAAAPPARMWW